MKTRDLMELAGRNLREAMLRNSLTTIGIAVGVASLVAMLSLGIGLQKLVMGRLQSSGLFNRVYVTPRPKLVEVCQDAAADAAVAEVTNR